MCGNPLSPGTASGVRSRERGYGRHEVDRAAGCQRCRAEWGVPGAVCAVVVMSGAGCGCGCCGWRGCSSGRVVGALGSLSSTVAGLWGRASCGVSWGAGVQGCTGARVHGCRAARVGASWRAAGVPGLQGVGWVPGVAGVGWADGVRRGCLCWRGRRGSRIPRARHARVAQGCRTSVVQRVVPMVRLWTVRVDGLRSSGRWGGWLVGVVYRSRWSVLESHGF